MRLTWQNPPLPTYLLLTACCPLSVVRGPLLAHFVHPLARRVFFFVLFPRLYAFLIYGLLPTNN